MSWWVLRWRGEDKEEKRKKVKKEEMVKKVGLKERGDGRNGACGKWKGEKYNT